MLGGFHGSSSSRTSSIPCSLCPEAAFTSGVPYTPPPCSYFPRPSSGTSSLVAKLHSLYELHCCVQVNYIHYPTTWLCMSSSDNTAKIPISLSNYSLFILSSWSPCGYQALLSGPPCSICQQLVPYLFDYQIWLHPVPHPLLLKI